MNSIASLANWDIRKYPDYVESGKIKSVVNESENKENILPFIFKDNNGGNRRYQPLMVVTFILLSVYLLNAFVRRLRSAK